MSQCFFVGCRTNGIRVESLLGFGKDQTFICFGERSREQGKSPILAQGGAREGAEKQPHGLQPGRLLCPRILEWVAISREQLISCQAWFLLITKLLHSQVVKNPLSSAGDTRDVGSVTGLGKSPGEGNGNPLQFLPGKFHGQRSLADYSLWKCKGSDLTEHTHA